jgi:CBS domain-containing protein
LVRCGFPRCKGGIMASTPDWCQPYSAWKGYFDRWIATPDAKEVLHATIFFDFRAGFGELELGARLRDHLMRAVHGQEVFLRHLAKDCMGTPAPLSFLRNFVVEKEGEHKGRFDLKTRGLLPFVDFSRLMALKCGVRETNTLERLQLLGEGGHVSHELVLHAAQAYEFQMQLRLVHQQQMDEEGLEPDNYIDPGALSDIERRTLKEAFAVVGDIKSYIKEAFRLASA